MKQRSAGKPDIELGKRIRLRRVEQKISQAELGDKLGVSFQQVQKYEKGVNRVGAARLQQIATALDVPVTFFYDGDGKAREVESLLFLDSAFSLRLLRAYSKIKDQTVQRQLVSLMESIAANEDYASDRRARQVRPHLVRRAADAVDQRQRIGRQPVATPGHMLVRTRQHQPRRHTKMASRGCCWHCCSTSSTLSGTPLLRAAASSAPTSIAGSNRSSVNSGPIAS